MRRPLYVPRQPSVTAVAPLWHPCSSPCPRSAVSLCASMHLSIGRPAFSNAWKGACSLCCSLSCTASDRAALIPLSNSSLKSRLFTQTKRWRVPMSAFNRSSISGVIVLMGAGWEAWLVKVLTFILCVCGCNGLVRTGHVIAWALFYPSL